MKKSVTVILLGTILCCSCVFLCACKAEEEEPVPEISYIEEETELGSSFEELIAAYFSAVAKQDHVNVTRYTTEDFIWNYDETGFDDYSRYITDFSVTEIDTAHITQENDEYTVPVSYVLTYDSPHTDENRDEQDSGDFTYNCNIVIVQEGDRYLISDITDRALG